MKINPIGNLVKTKPIQSQYKPNSRKAKMKLNFYSTKDYENKSDWKLGENKPNSNPIKPNFKPSAWDGEPVEPLIHRAKPKFLSKAPKS